jgi:hypothetical protein
MARRRQGKAREGKEKDKPVQCKGLIISMLFGSVGIVDAHGS